MIEEPIQFVNPCWRVMQLKAKCSPEKLPEMFDKLIVRRLIIVYIAFHEKSIFVEEQPV